MVGMKLFVSLALISLAFGGRVSDMQIKKVDMPEPSELNLCPTCVSLVG